MELHFKLSIGSGNGLIALVIIGVMVVAVVALTLTLGGGTLQGDGDRLPEVTLSVRPSHGLDQAQQDRVEGARRALDDGPGVT